MKLSNLPENAFIDPSGANKTEIESLWKEALEKVLAFSSDAEEYDCLPKFNNKETTFDLPEESLDQNRLMELIEFSLQHSMNPLNPRYIGHMDSMPTAISQVADLVAASVNNNMLSLEMSPFFSRLEKEITTQLAHQFGLGDQAGGVMLSGGSLANLQALTVARNYMLDTKLKVLGGSQKRPVILASEAAHTSLQKAAMIMGLGSEAIISVPTDNNSKMDIQTLENILGEIELKDQIPFCLVATAGTTTTGNIDPLPKLAGIAKEYELWFHVDAAYGGALIFSEEQKNRLDGIEQADSITFNPQKWMYVAKTSAMVLFRDTDLLQEHFQIDAPYMKDDCGSINIGEISVQGTRHADVLKLWLTLHHIGEKGYEQLIDESYRLTGYMQQQIEQRSFLELSGAPEMNILCFRGVPDHFTKDQWDNWNTDLNKFLLEEANFFLSLPTYRGNQWQRAVLLNPFTEISDLAKLFEYIDEFEKRKKK